MGSTEKTPADSGRPRKDTDVPPERVGPGVRPRDGADPELSEEQRRARIGSAGGGPYAPGAPGAGPPPKSNPES